MQHKIVNMLDPQSSQPPTQKVFQRHTQYDPTMKHSHCETVYDKELYQRLFFEMVHCLQIISILPTYKLAGLTKECQWCTSKAPFGLSLKLKIELKINFNQAQNWWGSEQCQDAFLFQIWKW